MKNFLLLLPIVLFWGCAPAAIKPYKLNAMSPSVRADAICKAHKDHRDYERKIKQSETGMGNMRKLSQTGYRKNRVCKYYPVQYCYWKFTAVDFRYAENKLQEYRANWFRYRKARDKSFSDCFSRVSDMDAAEALIFHESTREK